MPVIIILQTASYTMIDDDDDVKNILQHNHGRRFFFTGERILLKNDYGSLYNDVVV